MLDCWQWTVSHHDSVSPAWIRQAASKKENLMFNTYYPNYYTPLPTQSPHPAAFPGSLPVCYHFGGDLQKQFVGGVLPVV